MKAWVHIEEIGEVSFDEIFRKFYRSMCSCATHFLKDHDAAEDIVQEVFVSLWTKKSVFRTMSDLKTFLYVSVKNRCLNYIRDRKQQVDYDALSESEQEEEFKDWLIDEETYRMIDEAIGRLAPQSAKIMRLSLEGKQNQEIAELLDVSVNTVKTLKYNALDKLKEMLKDYFYVLLLLLCD